MSIRNQERKSTLQRLENNVLHNDILSKQFYIFQIAFEEPSPEKIVNKLYNALYLTLPDFKIEHLHHYRLSWQELSILNNLAYQYRFTNEPYIGINILYRLYEYYTSNPIDILLAVNTQSILLNNIIETFYIAKRFPEGISFFSLHSFSILNYSHDISGIFYFYYSQTLGEVNHISDARTYGIYSYYIEKLNNRPANANILSNALLRDFNIKID